MKHLLQSLHRYITLYGLKGLMQRVRIKPSYEPAFQRVLYIAASCMPYHISGYTTRTHELLLALRASGADVRVLTRPGYPWDRKDRLCSAGGPCSIVQDIEYCHASWPSHRRLLLAYAVQASKVVEAFARQHAVACIHAASNHTSALPALMAARRLGIPFQYEMRGLWELSRASRQPEFEGSHHFRCGLELEGLVAQAADRVFVISEELGNYAQRHWGIAESKLVLLPNCADITRIYPDATLALRPTTIGYAGSLVGYEGLNILIQAVHRLANGGVDVRLEIMGDGEARFALEGLAARLALNDRVHFAGKMSPEAARALLQHCALVCIPRQPFEVCRIVPPMKLVEALALGKAVVVPDLPVFRQELGADGVGWFFRSGDAENLAQVLAEALASPHELALRGARGRYVVTARRQWRHYVDNIVHYGGE